MNIQISCEIKENQIEGTNELKPRCERERQGLAGGLHIDSGHLRVLQLRARVFLHWFRRNEATVARGRTHALVACGATP